ncbi:cAMP-specific phosphodiesterase [Angomonas deanei]|uniref:Phosphodiesterase n=1 Tax=Angomonas deanei TaxID=59799 RepID=A0A7G2CFI4_9TRYP|nr:cAMP-specific phosphodiesterase [Angomonas deanei]CAD2218658.1 3'5'-cyclic nucleotide phosphodiesterase, putative [Angomonas deanei]|eukprot:EPY17854.1 cAMP-specific phosphodiesterase [Angomonas deanei]
MSVPRLDEVDQTSAVERFNAVAAELRNVSQELREANDELKKKNKELSDEINRLQSVTNHLQHEKSLEEQKCLKLTTQNTRLSRTNTELQEKCEQLLSSNETEKQERESIKAELDKLKLEHERAVTDLQGKSEKPSIAQNTGSRWAHPTIVEDISLSTDVHIRVGKLTNFDHFFQCGYDVTTCCDGDLSVFQSVAHFVAVKWQLFDADKKESHRWNKACAMLEANYKNNPYHNAVHAADVLQGTCSLIAACPGLLAAMSKVEKVAVVFAALAHDVRHPGRAQNFLKATIDHLYLVYGGNSVLETMHVFSAFNVLSVEEADFTSDWNSEEALQLHSIVSKIITHTDMALHMGSMQKWGARVSGNTLNIQDAADRLEILTLFVHAADIGAQTKGLEVSQKWTSIVEEMYAQGDDEKRLGLPISPGNARGGSFERGQIFFLETFVWPIYDLINQLFPSIEAPIVNLKTLHQHYVGKLGEQKDFPSRANFVPPLEQKIQSLSADVERYRAAVSKMVEAQNKAPTPPNETPDFNSLIQEFQKRFSALEEREERAAAYQEKLADIAGKMYQKKKKGSSVEPTNSTVCTEGDHDPLRRALELLDQAMQRSNQ